MLRYLNETLGIKAEAHDWDMVDRLPLFLKAGRKYTVLSVENRYILCVYMKPDAFNLSAFQKQMDRLHGYWPGEVALCFDSLTTYQRKALIENRMAFIVPGSQLYLPYLGMLLQERMTLGKKVVSSFSAAAQHVLLYFLYNSRKPPVKKVELSKLLGVSAMQITRAVQELTALELVVVEKSGRSAYVEPAAFGKQLYERAKPYLINPVQKRVFLPMEDRLTYLPYSGQSALSKYSMLNAPLIPCKAMDRKLFRKEAELETKCIDPAWYSGNDYIELEIWKYDPAVHARNGAVDILSLAAVFADAKDERVEMAVEKMLEGYEW